MIKNLGIQGKPTAKFLGYQEQLPGKAPVPLYNVFGGKLDKSTVSRETLEREGIEVPETSKIGYFNIWRGEAGRGLAGRG